MSAYASVRFGGAFALLTLLPLSLLAQTSKNSGKEFWIALPYVQNHTYEAVVTGEDGTIVTFDQPAATNQVYSRTDTLDAGKSITIEIDHTHSLLTANVDIGKRGISITSDQDVSVILYTVKDDQAAESTSITPVSQLGNHYLASTYYADGQTIGTILTIIATKDSTDLRLVPSVDCDKWNKDQEYEFSLSKGQVIQLSTGDDLTGTKIYSVDQSETIGSGNPIMVLTTTPNTKVCKPAQLINNNQVHSGCSGKDNMLIDQLMPVDKWAEVYPLVPYGPLANDVVRVLALEDDTELSLDGVVISEVNADGDTVGDASLSAGSFISFLLPNHDDSQLEAFLLESNKPVTVTHLSRSNSALSPVQQIVPAFERRSTHASINVRENNKVVLVTEKNAEVTVNGEVRALGWFKDFGHDSNLVFSVLGGETGKMDIHCYQGVQVFSSSQTNVDGQFAHAIHTGSIDWDSDAPFTTIEGTVFNDMDGNCEMDLWEASKPLANMLIRATPGPYFARTDDKGNFSLRVAKNAEYEISQILPASRHQLYQQVCPSGSGSYTVSTSDTSQTENLLFGNKVKYCPHMVVDVAPFKKRRCYTSNTLVRYANIGFSNTNSAVVKVYYPSHIKPISSIPAWDAQMGDTLIWKIGHVPANSDNYFIRIKDSVVCGDESIRGATQCFNAEIWPLSDCLDDDGLWDKSDLTLSAECITRPLGHAVRFTVKNIGEEDMDVPTDYQIFVNATLATSGTDIILDQGDSTTFEITVSEGETVRLEVENTPHHPYRAVVLASVEGCESGSDEYSEGYIMKFGQADEEDHLSTSCVEIKDSFDPNDKLGLPIGFGEERYISPEEELTFRIRFQNTGNDTAYHVSITDPLDKDLDLSTLKMSASSHEHQWRLVGSKDRPRLIFDFANIYLPDSTTDLLGSEGFVEFKIMPNAAIPEGEEITNVAKIFFDFNKAITTNEVRYTIWEGNPEDPSLSDRIKRYTGKDHIFQDGLIDRVSIYPNPAQNHIAIQLDGSVFGETLDGVSLGLYNTHGQLIKAKHIESPSDQVTVSLAGLPTGVYYLRLSMEGHPLGSKKLIKH